ncbi:MAG: hypothetical protein WBL19_03345 [Minisyncoccia bacterium]
MYELLIGYGILAVIVGLVIFGILALAKRGRWFMKIAQGTTAFISAGDSLKAILPNVGGFKISSDEDLEGRRWLVPAKNNQEREEAFFHNCLPGTVWFQKLLWRRAGVRWISILWPHTHRYTFDIRSRKRLLEGAEVAEGAPLKKRVVDSAKDGTRESTVVDSLLFIVPRPVYLEGVVLAGDNSKINLLLLPQFRQIIPALPAYYLRGDFFTLLDGAIEAGTVDFFATYRVKKNEDEDGESLTYAHWLKLAKSGAHSPLEQHLYHLNVNKKYYDELENAGKGELIGYLDDVTHGKLFESSSDKVEEKIPSGMIPRFGFAMVSFRLIGWEPHGDTKDLAKALLAKQTEFHTAEGVRQKADGERDALMRVAEGESNRYTRLATALVDKGVTPDVAARVVETQLRTENIRDGKVTTYVEGGSPASIMVPASNQAPSK